MSGPIPDPGFCLCCAAPTAGTPADIFNRPGLSQIGFRIGTFATFRESMLEGIAGEPALVALTTRESDDYAITLLELFAAVGDVLTFYNERIANELFLRSAAQRDSIGRLVRLIGYRLRPGLAATATLAFELDAGARTRIRDGLKVMSMPAQDQSPAIYETIEEIIAHGDLNALPVFAPPQPFNAFLKGQAGAPLLRAPDKLTKGDALVYFGTNAVEEKTVDGRDQTPGGERLRFIPPVQTAGWWPDVAWAAKIERRARFFGFNAPLAYQAYDTDINIAPQNRWSMDTLDTSFVDGTNSYPLDARYDDIKPGAELLIDCGASGPAPRLRTAVVVDAGTGGVTLPLPTVSPTKTRAVTDTVTSVTLRQTMRGRPAAIRPSGGGDQRVLVRAGGGGALFYDTSVSGQNRALGALMVSSDFSAVTLGGYPIAASVRDAFGMACIATWTASGWTSWQPIPPGPVTSTPRAVAVNGHVLVFARGLDLGLWYSDALPALNAFAPLGGVIASDPVPVSWGPNRIDVFVRGADRGLWRRVRDSGTWLDWEGLGGVLAGTPAAASTAAGRLDVVALDDSGALLHKHWDGVAWSDWLDLGGSARGTPAIAVLGPDAIAVFVHGTDDQLWEIDRTGTSWSAWTARGGNLMSSPDVVVSSGTMDVFVNDSTGSLARLSGSGTVWAPWTNFDCGLGPVADRRNARIYVLNPKPLVFRDYDYAQALSGGTFAAPLKPGQSAAELGSFALLAKDRQVMIQAGGTRHMARIANATPIATVLGGPADHLQVDFAPPVPQPLAGVVLRANLADASHGETQPDEVLGNGDATAPFQKFQLQRAPLTFLPDETSPDAKAALEVRVNGELWQAVPSLYGRSPKERVYTARLTDQAATVLTFGDGRTGATVPTGVMNVVASYRKGLGLGGRVVADQLSIPLERPVGLRAVANPFASDGAADPESRDDARGDAPTTVRTFGRIVSLLDFEWLATSSGLVARAYATWVWNDMQRIVHLTVAAQGGQRLSDTALAGLYASLTSARDPNHRLLLANLNRVPLVVAARILADPTFKPDVVLQNAREALLDRFAFENVPLGAAVHASHVYAALQEAPGVGAVGLDLFQLKGYAALTAKELQVRTLSIDQVQSHIR
ncbi:MAG TPA: hypothetical protein VGB91_01165, partial [Rhizomicrobium sp.]